MCEGLSRKFLTRLTGDGNAVTNPPPPDATRRHPTPLCFLLVYYKRIRRGWSLMDLDGHRPLGRITLPVPGIHFRVHLPAARGNHYPLSAMEIPGNVETAGCIRGGLFMYLYLDQVPPAPSLDQMRHFPLPPFSLAFLRPPIPGRKEIQFPCRSIGGGNQSNLATPDPMSGTPT